VRTNIELDDDLLELAMRAGPFKTKKDTVEAGLKLLTRQAAYRDILALRGQLRWEDTAEQRNRSAEKPREEPRTKPRAEAAAKKQRAGKRRAASNR
jgi:antitoxin ParD1/3/4